MSTHILKESDWEDFIQKFIFSMIIRPHDTSATIFALVGDLGAGKTTFSKAFLKELGIKQHVQSPTFSIINSYDITQSSIKFAQLNDFSYSDESRMMKVGAGMANMKFKKVFHMDMYRLEDKNELHVLHIDDIFSNPEHIVLIEWADKIKSDIPQSAHWIYFEHDSMKTRKITIN